jgi:L-asparaginase
MPRVVVLSTGGTIASRYSADHGAVISQTNGDELLAGVRHLPEDLSIETEQFSNVGSYAIQLEDALRMALRIETILAAADVLGVVVTHGTDTMEESAYLSDLVIRSDKPVVFTGAMRAADDLASDGPRNLSDAIRVASAPHARGLGSVIVFEQEIHAARDATKMHASRTGTFTSSEHGKLGEIDGDAVILHRRPERKGNVAAHAASPAVDVIKVTMGSDGRFVDFAVRSGARALVLEAFGRGNPTPAVTQAARRAVEKGVTVAVTSRCPQGRVAPVYGAGGGADLAAAGAIFAGDLSSVKARILLALLVGAEADAATMRTAVQHHGN